jgi:fibronectin type 3 domain-containing protein
MIRDSLNANAANAFIGVMPGNRVVFQYRSSDGGGSSSNSVTGLSASYWVKLAQSGNTLTGYYSVDGVMWTQLGLATNSMGSTNYAGLAYCNNGNSSSGTVTFYSVACTGQLFVPSAPTGLTALAGVEQVTLTWQAASNAASYDIGRSTVSGGSYTTVGSTSGTNYTDVNLVGRTTYYYVVTAVSPGSQGTNSDQVSATPAANVPPPWVAQDIGPVAVAGSESCTSNLFTVTASGNDIASAADAFRFVYETNSGNCTIVVRVASLQSIDGWSLAGVMIRGSLNANAANVFIGLTPSNGVVFEHRSADGTLEGVDNNVASPVAPCWVALVQSGSTFTGYYSVDGVNWNQLGTTMVSMGVTKYVGMAVCSRKGLSLCTATFDNVSAPGWPSLAGPTGVTATATSSGQVNLTWNALTNATSYIVKRSTVSGGPYSIIARGLIATNFTDNVVAVGIKYYYVVSAIIGDLESSGSPEATVNLPLLSPWVSQDIGGAVSQSSAIYNNGVFSVTGAGADIQGTADAFRFAYVPVTGNCTIIARVSGVQNIDPWSKAGVMIRDSVAANGANAFIGVTPGNGVTWQYRSTDGGGTIYNNTGSLTAPCWLKLVRSGNTFTGYYSPDGVTWTQQGTATCTIGTSALVGLAVTSHNSSSVCTATFDNVTVPGWPLLPRVPGSLTATAGNAQVTLSWPAVSGASSYNLKSATNSGGSYVVLTNMTTTAYTNTGLLNGTTYFYVVSALNIAGESTNSVPASATPQAPPTLVISQTGANFMISWPLASAGFTLQSCTNLAAANWVNVTSPAPQIVGSQWQVVLPPPGAGSSAYYRLSK